MPILKDLSAVELKEHGNKLYRHQKYKEALEYYNRAIVSRDKQFLFFFFFLFFSDNLHDE